MRPRLTAPPARRRCMWNCRRTVVRRGQRPRARPRCQGRTPSTPWVGLATRGDGRWTATEFERRQLPRAHHERGHQHQPRFLAGSDRGAGDLSLIADSSDKCLARADGRHRRRSERDRSDSCPRSSGFRTSPVERSSTVVRLCFLPGRHPNFSPLNPFTCAVMARSAGRRSMLDAPKKPAMPGMRASAWPTASGSSNGPP